MFLSLYTEKIIYNKIITIYFLSWDILTYKKNHARYFYFNIIYVLYFAKENCNYSNILIHK